MCLTSVFTLTRFLLIQGEKMPRCVLIWQKVVKSNIHKHEICWGKNKFYALVFVLIRFLSVLQGEEASRQSDLGNTVKVVRALYGAGIGCAYDALSLYLDSS